jgi:hypothetical protein
VNKKEEFLELAAKADFCLVKRLKDRVKLKLRVGSYLYTFQTTPEEVESITKLLKCNVEEL